MKSIPIATLATLCAGLAIICFFLAREVGWLKVRVANIEVGNCFDLYNYAGPRDPDGKLTWSDGGAKRAQEDMDSCFKRLDEMRTAGAPTPSYGTLSPK